MPKTNSRTKRPFRIFEAGFGSPSNIIGKAMASSARGKNRHFTAVEKSSKVNKFKLWVALKKAGLKTLPGNITLLEGCAIDALFEVTPKSQDVIFASYLTNNLADPELDAMAVGGEKRDFFEGAKRALAKNGRMILLQDLGAHMHYAAIANAMGFKIHIIPLSDKVLRKSSGVIRKRSTPLRRKLMLAHYLKDARFKASMPARVKGLQDKGLGSKPTDVARPAVYIFREAPYNKSGLERDITFMTIFLESYLGFDSR